MKLTVLHEHDTEKLGDIQRFFPLMAFLPSHFYLLTEKMIIPGKKKKIPPHIEMQRKVS